VVSVRVPGSYLDAQYPDARVGDAYFRGSGTSQAAAVVSGAAALILSQRPNMSPDQVKSLLMATAQPIPNASYSAQGAGLIDLSAAFNSNAPDAGQYWQHSNGSPQGVWWNVADATGNSWSTASAGNSWSGNSWTSSGWTGPGWDDEDFVAGNSWSSVGWLDASLTKSRERGVCTEWFLEKKRDSNGVSWGKKIKQVHSFGAGSRDEFGVSWGKRGKEIRGNRSLTLDFCDWMNEQLESTKVVRVDTSGGQSVDASNSFRELGVSWGKRRMTDGVTTTRRGWSVA
jgi:hypothetical protein